MKIFLVFIAVLLILPARAEKIKYENIIDKTWKNSDCKKTGTCSLKSFSVLVEDYIVKFSPDDTSYGTTMVARYRTDRVSSLEDYVIVNFIRGCIFESYLKNGEIIKGISTSRDFFGGSVRFRHPEWVIDSVDEDPVYWSASEEKLPRPPVCRT